ncbi:MAG TPA: iron-containing redox enzyme family protein [Acidimicrobiales bacterium]|nr:iron-containing redox enzyme family protein [Acidimicrobiales bacterium]
MSPTEVELIIARITDERRLLSHPFYVRWEAGDLSLSDLASYASQYRHFEQLLPSLLADVASKIVEGSSALASVLANLADETGNADGPSHLEIFDDFARSVGARPLADATPATSALVEVYESAMEKGPAEALAALAAYEFQSPEIAKTKAAGLRDRYGLDGTGTRFWDVHATLDEEHKRWTLEALGAITDDGDRLAASAEAAADAWWAFLDERESSCTLVRA